MLPTPEKTWQVAHISNTLHGDEPSDFADFFIKLKNAAKAFGSHPLTVAGSSDHSTANMTGTDLLADVTHVFHANAGTAHSWIVMALNQIATGAQVCLDLCHPEHPGTRMDIIVSATGFSGGSTTARPTATDEIVLFANSAWQGMIGSGDDTGGQLRAHLMLSTDGTCFRIIVANNNVVGGFLLIDKPGNPVSGWTNPMVSVALGLGIFNNTSNTLLQVADTWYAANILQARGPIGVMPLFPTFECPMNFTTIGTRRNGPNEISGEYPLQPIGLWHDVTAGQRGRHGRIVDLWFTNVVLANGDTMPADGSKQFIVFGDAVFVGDGTDWATI